MKFNAKWWFPSNLAICMPQCTHTHIHNSIGQLAILFNYRPCHFYYIHMAHVVAIWSNCNFNHEKQVKIFWIVFMLCCCCCFSLDFRAIHWNPTQHCNSQMYKIVRYVNRVNTLCVGFCSFNWQSTTGNETFTSLGWNSTSCGFWNWSKYMYSKSLSKLLIGFYQTFQFEDLSMKNYR